ncbi:MAG TPA: ACT domain-containing protein [Candidatus Eisenbacteria bacterium]|nr:ACT domain-containing protein [Candidatus Eisenbacteria bacterium]
MIGRRTLFVEPQRLAICRYDAGAPFPAWAMHEDARFWSVTRTPDELSVVCDEDAVPPSCSRVESGWRALRLAGPIDLAETGVLASLAAPLASASVALFAISTFDTDYLLVREESLERAVAALAAEFAIER